MVLLDLIFGSLINPSSSLADLKKSIRKDSKEEKEMEFYVGSAQPLRSFDEMKASIREEEQEDKENNDVLTGLSEE